MLILGFFEALQEIADELGKFVSKNFDNPMFWVVVFVVLLAVGIYGITKFADK